MQEPADGAVADDVYKAAKASRFQFKSKSDRPRRSRRHSREDGERSSKRHRSDEDDRHHRDSRRSHKRRHRTTHDDRHPTSTRDGTYYDPDYRHRESLYDNLEESSVQPDVDPNEAFRESLFDALADDEGAAYWEGVYGQPIHVYADTKPGPDGKLERMSEEEYAEYVRTKMWEKSHQHIVEEREARERARQERKKKQARCEEETRAYGEEGARIRKQMAESLKRGEERKRAKELAAAWETYTQKWDGLKSAQQLADEEEVKVQELIPWPVVSGRAKHIDKEEIERFLKSSPAWKENPAAVLKIERVRWHPDKMQQRFGHHLDADTMKSVTAVFQVVDRLWSERR